MRKTLRIISLVMLLVAIAFVIFAFLTMDVPIDLPFTVSQLRTFYKIYLVVMISLFVLSFFFRKKKTNRRNRS